MKKGINRHKRYSHQKNPPTPATYRARKLRQMKRTKEASQWRAKPARLVVHIKQSGSEPVLPPVCALQPAAGITLPSPLQKQGFPPVYRRVLLRCAAMIGVFVLAVVCLFFGATTIISYGPSEAARNLFVSTVMETSAAKFLAQMYFDDAQIETMLAGDTIKSAPVATTTTAVTIAPKQEEQLDSDGITIEDVWGNTFVGKKMIVNDPSRIVVKTLPYFDAYGEGMALADMIAESDAIAGINAGGFLDPNGMGRGGMPMGVVIHEGKLLCETETRYPTIVGFDADHKLVAGNFSAQEAINTGMQEAVSFGPVLVSDGKMMPLAGGVNPRTAIGQRADGAVLLLVVDGRQPHSLGATHSDLAKLMLEYGAVNAANLDGGSSSLMIYEGEALNAYSMLTGPRKLPTAFLVKRLEEKPDATS